MRQRVDSALMGLLRIACVFPACMVLLAACSGEPAIKPAELTKFNPSAQAKVIWRVRPGSSKGSIFTPALYDGSVIAAAGDGMVARYHADSGKEIWRVDTKRPLTGGVGADADRVVVGTKKGEVLALNGKGKPVWTGQVSSQVLGAPTVADGFVIVRSGDGRIVVFDAKDGARKWEYTSTMPALLLRSDAGVTVARGVVYAGLHNGRIVALSLANGTVLWEAAVAQPKGANELERMVDVAAAPIVEDGQVCAIAFQGRVACFDPLKGTLLWGRDGSSTVSLGGDAGTLYITGERGAVQALDRSSGASYWKMDKLYGRQVSAPVVLGRYVAVGDLNGYVHFLNREDGAFSARVATDNSAIVARPQRLGSSRVLVQSRDGGVYAIEIN